MKPTFCEPCWGPLKKEMKAYRHKTGDGGGKKKEKCSILERQELVVQKLHVSLEVSRKAQKYTRVGPCEFVQYDVEELSIEGKINVQTMNLNLTSSKIS